MSKIIDNNSFWEIKHNPISKVGVFPYMGRSISDDCEPNKIYYVFRSAETLKDSVPTWDNPPKPFINDHEMLGEGFSKIDERPVQGVIHNPVFEDDVLYADISVYSESLKEKIANGKKELSLGYFCKYRKEKGVYKGQTYDYVQEDMVGNHIALVDNGRCGSDVKVFDSKCTMDSLDISSEIESLKTEEKSAMIKTTEEKGSDMKEEEKKEVEVKDEELEKKEEQVAVKDQDKEEEKKAEDKCGKDEDLEKKEEKKAEDEGSAEIVSLLKQILEAIKGSKAQDEAEEEEKSESEKKSEDEAEEEEKSEKAEDEDEEEEKKAEKAEDSSDIVVTFAKDSREAPKSLMDDPALRKYLNI